MGELEHEEPGAPRRGRGWCTPLLAQVGLALAGSALLGLALPVFALASPATPELIPMPRVLSEGRAWLRLDAGSRVSSDRAGEDAYATALLTELVRTSARYAGSDRSLPAVRSVVLRAGPVPGRPAGTIADQSYAIDASRDRVVITGPTAAARLHGAVSLRQLVRGGRGCVPSCRIVDGPVLAVRGLSLDISRGRMPTGEEFVRILDTCVEFKLNMLQLYIEDTFPFRGVPGAALRSYSLTPSALRAVAREARTRGITLVPIVQTLGHQERMLSHASMRDYSELNAPRPGWDGVARAVRRSVERVLEQAGLSLAAPAPSGMFAPTDAGAQRLVGSMVDDVLAASGATAVHIGCDEATELGRGASAADAAHHGVEGVYLDHVRRLARHAKARWGAGTWIYADFVLQHPALLDSLPLNITLVDWHYDPDAAFGSLDSLRGVAANRIVTSAGLWNWFAIYPDYARAFPNIRNATAAAQSRRCRGALLASWGDGGAEDLFGNDVLGLAYFADRAWSPAAQERPDFVAAYCRARFGPTAGKALPVYRAMSNLELPNVGYNQRLVYRPVLVRGRTPAWKAAMLRLNARMKAARAALPGIAAADADAPGELQALASTVDRFLAATERELTLDSLAADFAVASTTTEDRRAQQGASLTRLLALEAGAAAGYAAAWRAHNQESELPAVLSRLRQQRAVLDSLQHCALAGRLEVPVRFRAAK
jgi:hypothetical protein